MKTSIYTRHRFHPDIIKRAVWLYFRFNLSFRDVEELMIERGVDVSYETIRRWVEKFGSTYAKRIKSGSERPSPVWHLDEVYTKIGGKMVYLWRAVDDEGTVLDIVVQRRRNTKAATRLLRKLLKNQGVKPTKIVTDKLGSYGAALKILGLKYLQDVGGRKNNRAECSHAPIRRRERKSQKFRSIKNAQKLLSAHGQIYNLFNHRRHLISRNTLRRFRQEAQTEWKIATASACAYGTTYIKTATRSVNVTKPFIIPNLNGFYLKQGHLRIGNCLKIA